MKTVVIGGGKGCCAIIELARGSFLKELTLDIDCVVDLEEEAPGMICARQHGIRTSSDMAGTLATPGLELIIELTGNDTVLEEIYRTLPPGVKLVDHTFAHIFWDLVNAQQERNRQLHELTTLELRVEKEREFLQSLFDTMTDLMVVLNRNRSIVRANASFGQFVSVSPREAVGKTCESLFAGTEFASKSPEMLPMMESVLSSKAPFALIWRTAPPNEAYWEVTSAPIHASDGDIEEVVVTWHRITERVRLQREVESAEQRFRSFIDSAQDWISIKDLEGRYLVVNPVIASAFHKTPEDFIGRVAEEVLPGALAKTIKRHDQEVISKKKHRVYDEIIQIDGRDHFFHTVRFPLSDYRGSTVGVCTIARDVTSEKELRNQLVQSEKLAAVGKLAAGVAHEINNPLTGVLAYAEDIIDDLPENDAHLDDLRVIVREALRCRDIVRNLLDFARQEAPKLEEAAPNGVVTQSLLLVEKLPQFRNITIKRSLEDDLPLIKCDPHQIQQVILNLMLNAADAMNGKGTITIATEFDLRQSKCVISVEDNGPGIPENLMDKVFEPFFSTKGTSGLGLAVSWGLIERHGGVIEVDTAAGGGSIFRIVLPAMET
jgi:PAS domain S-box-containing protein